MTKGVERVRDFFKDLVSVQAPLLFPLDLIRCYRFKCNGLASNEKRTLRALDDVSWTGRFDITNKLLELLNKELNRQVFIQGMKNKDDLEPASKFSGMSYYHHSIHVDRTYPLIDGETKSIGIFSYHRARIKEIEVKGLFSNIVNPIFENPGMSIQIYGYSFCDNSQRDSFEKRLDDAISVRSNYVERI